MNLPNFYSLAPPPQSKQNTPAFLPVLFFPWSLRISCSLTLLMLHKSLPRLKSLMCHFSLALLNWSAPWEGKLCPVQGLSGSSVRKVTPVLVLFFNVKRFVFVCRINKTHSSVGEIFFLLRKWKRKVIISKILYEKAKWMITPPYYLGVTYVCML